MNTVAKVEIIGHDEDNSEVYTEPATETYWRLIKAGTYSVTFSSPGFETQTFDDVVVNDYEVTILDVHMNSAVPVELTSFTADLVDKNIHLKWRTETETNNKGFEIERQQYYEERNGFENSKWLTLGFVGGSGTSTDPQFYNFTDDNVIPGNYKYRLKQIDFDGSSDYSNTLEVEIGDIIPNKFELFRNYPNPFNPSTIIKYTIPENGNVSLKIFDLIGNELTTLVDDVQLAGEYKVEFNGSQYPSGIYLYQLTWGRLTASNKLILLK